MELDENKVDAWGIPAMKISCKWRDNEWALFKDAQQTGAEMLEAAGAKDGHGAKLAIGTRGRDLRDGFGADGKRPKDFCAEWLEPGT
jgi:hypothetical protein